MIRPSYAFAAFLLILGAGLSYGQGDAFVDSGTVEADLGASREALRTDTDAFEREAEEITLDGLNVAQMRELRAKAESHQFQAEVNRMMKLIINSLYKNKEIFLRELISNASDALDKIRLLSLTDKAALDATEEMSIKIRADPDQKTLHIIDTGVGMSKQQLVSDLGTIAKSGTSEFFTKISEAKDSQELNDLIGQFGVGFYSAFLVCDKVVVTSKSNEDSNQYIWESDSASFTVVEDPRGPTLKRGTQVTLHMKEEAYDFLAQDTITSLVTKYSQFINFPIYVWTSKTEEVEEEVEAVAKEEEEKKSEETVDEDGVIEEEKEKPKVEKKKVEKTTWDWERVNTAKPIWMRKSHEVEKAEYTEFYRTLRRSRTGEEALAQTHFTAEGEVTFKALLFVPPKLDKNHFQTYGQSKSNIKLYVRRVFITDEFDDLMPSYLNFILGVVDSDDLPLNVSRESLQQHKLLKVIRKKLVRKVLDMIKKMEPEVFEEFYAEYSTSLKLGVIEDASNRARLAKLLRFESSGLAANKMASLAEYIERMPEDQDMIYYMAGQNRAEVESSPFVERLLKKGYEVLYMTEAMDEYCINAIPEFEGKKFQSVAKEGLKIASSDEEEMIKTYKEEFEPLCDWLLKKALKDEPYPPLDECLVSMNLHSASSALRTPRYGDTGASLLTRIHARDKSNKDFYLKQKQHLEINPRHPIIKKMKALVTASEEDPTALSMAKMMLKTATLRSGFLLQDTAGFAKDIEGMMRVNMGIPLDEPIEGEPVKAEEAEETSQSSDKDEL